MTIIYNKINIKKFVQSKEYKIFKMVFVYVLQLEEGKYYVGKTTNCAFRLEQHFTSCGSAWTKKYKPINVVELIPNCDQYDEDKHTIKYMEKYGINNVRGGSFCETKLSDNNIITLNQMIKSVTDKCYICGNTDHFANDCKKMSITNPKNLTTIANEKCDCPTSYFSSHRRGKCLLNNTISYFKGEHDEANDNGNKVDINQNKNITCFKCGRKGHYSTSCYALKHINGHYL